MQKQNAYQIYMKLKKPKTKTKFVNVKHTKIANENKFEYRPYFSKKK